MRSPAGAVCGSPQWATLTDENYVPTAWACCRGFRLGRSRRVMDQDLAQERLDLLTRLGALEARHAQLKARPHDRQGHGQYHVELAVYREEVGAYRIQIAVLRSERGLPDPKLDFFD
jgi:hypothetical protein